MKISIDAMGGDYGPSSTIPATINILREHPAISLIQVYGDKNQIEDTLNSLVHFSSSRDLVDRIQIHHTHKFIASTERPSDALRKREPTSMLKALEALANGEVDACVSSGNTGALLGLARYSCGTIFENKDVAICAELPNPNRITLLLDVGANTDPTPLQLYNFSKMGTVLHRCISEKRLMKSNFPKLKVLSIGTEQGKGNHLINEFIDTYSSDKIINFCGLIEADKVLNADCDVIVCDGFTGNIVLKSIQGSVNYMNKIVEIWLQNNLVSNSYSEGSSISELKKNIEYNYFNGAVLLGINKIVIKSHGSSNSLAFGAAIKKAVDMISGGFQNNLSNQVM